MEPRFGETYHTTRKWNYDALPRTITRIDGIKFYYKVENKGTERCFTVDGLKRALLTGSWYLPFPATLRLPAGV